MLISYWMWINVLTAKSIFLLRIKKELEIPLLLLWYTWGVRYWQKWYFDIFSIMIIKQYLDECVFVLYLGWSLSWINKCEIKTASRWQQVPVSMSNSLNHSLKRFFKTADSFTNEASDCLNEQFIESFTQTILQNSWFVYKWSKWLCLNKSLNHSLKRFLQNSWFVYKWSKWLSQWAIHWIIHSNDSSKQLIRLQMKQVTVFE